MGYAVSVDIDFRTFVGKLTYECQDKVRKSVNDPGIKTTINESIYDIIWPDIPVVTGALRDSPLNAGFSGIDKRGIEHYASGSIDDSGITFAPYTISPKRRSLNYYASNVYTFQPYNIINFDRKAEVYEAIKDILVEDMNIR